MSDKFNEPTQRFPDDLIANPQEGLDAEEVAAISALPSGSALLVVKRGAADGSRFLLDIELSKAGRHPNAEIFLDDVTVSRKHAEFVRENGSFEIRDQASLNGTYLNGVRIDSATLSNGDEVQIGKFKLTFYSSPADKK
jgi:pSer/pThr/pTyr-binding forkhead associated (FHA) protein